MSFVLQQIGLFLWSIWTIWSLVWWLVLPIVAWIIYVEFREHHKSLEFHHGIKWKLLELKVPSTILKTPKAMEQIFSAAYLEGEKLWMSFEVVGRAGESHFYLRVPQQFRNMMEAAFYAQYPDAEISEAEDYVSQMPHEMPNAEFDLYGAEEILGNGEYLPIRTHSFFEENVEERRIDTVALLLESISKLKDDEQIWLQIIVKPVDEKWKKGGESAINKLMGIEEKKPHHGNIFSDIFGGLSLQLSIGDILLAPFIHPGTEAHKAEGAKEEKKPKDATPGAKEMVEGIRTKISKLGFETTVRFCYIDKRGSFVKDNISSMQAFFRQFNDQRLNFFKPDPLTVTAGVKGWFAARKLAYRKRVLFENYAHVHPRHGGEHGAKCVLNIEELATIYHFPIATVGTKELAKVGSRKGGPPASLPLVD